MAICVTAVVRVRHANASRRGETTRHRPGGSPRSALPIAAPLPAGQLCFAKPKGQYFQSLLVSHPQYAGATEVTQTPVRNHIAGDLAAVRNGCFITRKMLIIGNLPRGCTDEVEIVPWHGQGAEAI